MTVGLTGVAGGDEVFLSHQNGGSIPPSSTKEVNNED